MTDVKIGVDVGGTFTDVVAIDGPHVWTAKAPTTANFVDGVLAACDLVAARSGADLRVLLRRTRHFGLGTTAVTNAITSRRGVRVGLLTTRGFEETLHLSRGQLSSTDLRMHHGFEVVALQDIAGIAERIDRDGAVLRPLDVEEVVTAAEKLVDQGIEALSISFLWSIVNPQHERQAAAVVRASFPDLPLTVGSDLLPVAREYERTMLCVLNAYVSTACTGIEALRRQLSDLGLEAPIALVHSGGGTISVAEALARPIWLAESGPAAGVAAAAAVARAAGSLNCISCDMGGTSFDVSDVSAGEPSRVSRGELMGLWTALPRVDVESIGAGGGSIGWIDARGLLRVGPRSAGSRPGPVCYGLGGTEATVTDALVVLGYIDPENFLAGKIQLDREAAVEACAELGRPLGLDAAATAWGVREIALAEMTKAVRNRLALRGLDPREQTLVSYGGCASLFTAEIAKALGAPRIIVPPTASVLSALGAATLGMRRERVRSILATLPCGTAAIHALAKELIDEVASDLAADGVAPASRKVALEAEVRFVRQSSQISISLNGVGFDEKFSASLRSRFEAEYGRLYGSGSISAGTPVEIVALRAVGTGPGSQVPPLLSRNAEGASKGTSLRVIRSGPAPTAFLQMEVIDDAGVCDDRKIAGPLLIDRGDTSIWVPAGLAARRDNGGNILVEPL